MDTILAFDLGTTYFKAVLFDGQMQLLALARRSTPILPSANGYKEIDPGEFLTSAAELTATLREKSPSGYARVAAVTISTQANSFLLLDGKDRPLTPIILWSDNRARNGPFFKGHELPGFQQTTGIATTDPAMALTKVDWLRRNQPDTYAAARRFCSISDFLTLWLTGHHTTEAGVAGLTALLNIHTRKWWADACDQAGVPTAWLPSVENAGTDLGPIRAEVAERLQLPRSCRLFTGCLDQYAGAIGAGTCRPGRVSETTGTVLSTVRCTDTFSDQGGHIFQGPSFQPGWYWQMIFDEKQGASLLDNFRDLQPDHPEVATLDAEAASAPHGSGGLRLIGPFGSDPDAAFAGLTAQHTRGHKVRCIMETVAWTLKKQMEQLCGQNLPRSLRCCGGAARSQIWLEIKANVLGIPCAPALSPEPGCLGVALLAARGLGWRKELEWDLDTPQWVYPRHTGSL